MNQPEQSRREARAAGFRKAFRESLRVAWRAVHRTLVTVLRGGGKPVAYSILFQ
jgi:hypothetical protein